MNSLGLCASCRMLTQAHLIPFSHDVSYQSSAFYFAVEAGQAAQPTKSDIQEILRNHKVQDLCKVGHHDSRNVLVYSKADICISAGSGCRICYYVSGLFREWRYIPSDAKFNDTVLVYLEAPPDCVYHGGWLDCEGIIVVRYKSVGMKNSVVGTGTLETQIKVSPELLWLYVTSTTSKIPLSVATGPYIALAESTSIRIRDWILECRGHSHDKCAAYRSRSNLETGSYPRRVLEILRHGAQTLVRLRSSSSVQSTEASFSYVTLSHCWGKKGIPCSLKKSALFQYHQGIPAEDLPKTFRDAVTVTMALGFNYLWIDALCIVQDDADDWDSEAPRMAQVYSNSIVTLAAAVSEGPEGGLLVQNNFLLPIDTPVMWNSAGTMTRFSPSSAPGWLREIHEPLSQRAWVFQEEVLASRTIHFSADQIWWSCNQGLHGEHYSHNYDGTPGRKYTSGSQILTNWQELVEDYSKRSLTYSKDRLVALSGVAQAYGAYNGLSGLNGSGDYVAGLWRGPSLRSQLLWNVSPFDQRDPAIAGEDDFRIYTGPSWSWTSVDTRVSFTYCGQSAWHPSYTITSVVTTTTSDAGDPFSSFTSGTLIMRALLRRVSFRLSDQQPERVLHKILVQGLINGPVQGIAAHLDPKKLLSRDAHDGIFDAVFLPAVFLSASNNTNEEVAGLLLAPVAGLDGTYKRVGTMWSRNIQPTILDLLWNIGSEDIPRSQYLNKFDNGVYEVRLI